MTLSRGELAALPRTTPTAIAETRYAAGHAARPADAGRLPDRSAIWRRTVDPGVLKRVIASAFNDHLATVAPPAERRRVADALLADVDRRYLPADMAVLERYGLARSLDVLTVNTAFEPQRFPIPHRMLPTSKTELYAHIFTTIEAHVTRGVAAVPEDLRPTFVAIEAARTLFFDEFQPAEWWPGTFRGRHKRPPTWAEIEDAWPRIGAWMAKQRGV